MFKFTEISLALSTVYISFSMICMIIFSSVGIADMVLYNAGNKEKRDKIVDIIQFTVVTLTYNFMFGTFFFDV